MDNKEFVKVLLCEASELLNEVSNHGAKGNSVLNLMKDQETSNIGYDLMSGNKLSKYVYDKALDKYDKALADKDAKLLERFGKNARKYQKGITRGINLASKINKDPIINDPEYRDAVKAYTNTKPIKDKEKMRRNNIKLGYQIAKSASDSRKKSQNESADLAILLTEAALLLNESVGVKDKLTDKVIKVFNTNKEAADWIIANGGNEKYQLTNRLK